jgi:hypothetical protein
MLPILDQQFHALLQPYQRSQIDGCPIPFENINDASHERPFEKERRP